MTGLSKEEYLKRYLNPSEACGKNKQQKFKKKSNTKKKKTGIGIKIFDDDIALISVAPLDNDENDVHNQLLVDDEKPQIAELDTRSAYQKDLDDYRISGRWKKLGHADKEDVSNQTKNNVESDSDLDIPRISNMHPDSDSDLDVKRNLMKRHDSDSDLEIPRKVRKRTNSDSDLDTKKYSSNQVHEDSDSDLNLNINYKNLNRHDSDSDMDILRSNKNAQIMDNELKRRKKIDKTKGAMTGGGAGGLTSVDALRHEMQILKKKDAELSSLANVYKEERTIFRERSGKKRNMQKEDEVSQQAIEKRKQKEELYDNWGKGIKQTKMMESAIAETLHESNKPLARYADDKDLEQIRKEEMRAGDPMAAYISSKRRFQSKTTDLPKYRGPPPAPNRFGIQPGYRWDGVDRSNGFEKTYFDNISNREANKDDFYKWSVGDL